MGLFGKLFKGPEIDMEKSSANARKMRDLFNQAVPGGDRYQLIFGYTEDVSRFNYLLVHGSKTKIGNLIVGWEEESQTIAVVPTVPDLSSRGEAAYYRRSDILKAYRNKYPNDAFIIYPDKKSYIGINAYCKKIKQKTGRDPITPHSTNAASVLSAGPSVRFRNLSESRCFPPLLPAAS